MLIHLAALFFGSFTIGLSGALMPGPLLTVTVADSARRGFIAGPLLVAGHSILELALVVAVILGVGPILKMPLVMGAIALLGGAVLLWMGVSMVRSAAAATLEVEADARGPLSHPLVSGVLASASNPYWILWWSTIGLGYLLAAMKAGTIGAAAFFTGHISADFLWYSLISYGVSRGKKILKEKTYQLAIRACGFLLLLFGAWFLVSSAAYFLRR